MKVPKLCRHKARNKPYVRIDGKQKYLAGTFDENGADKEAVRSYEEFLIRYRNADSKTNLTIKECYASWAAFNTNKHKNDRLSKQRAIRSGHNLVYRQLVPYFDLTFAEMSVGDFEAIRQKQADRGYSIVTLRNYWNHLQKLIKFSVARGLAEPEVLVRIRVLPNINRSEYPDTKPRQVRHAVSEEQILETLPHLTDTVRTIILLCLGTGSRPQEVCDMRWGDIDKSKGVWEYRPEFHKGTWRESERVIFISAPMQRLLIEYENRRLDPSQDYIFTGAESWALHNAERYNLTPQDCYETRPDNVTGRIDSRRVYQQIQRICKRENIKPWTPYQCRHFFAERMLEKLSARFVENNGSDTLAIEAVSSMLGHKNVDITTVYAKRNERLGRDLLLETNIDIAAGQ